MILNNLTMQINPVKCTLCNSQTSLFYKNNNRIYFQCIRCSSVLLHPKFFLSPEKEKERYEEHNNNVEDIGYQKFVSPIVNEILKKFETHHHGLDFGAGTGPVIAKLLQQNGYKIELYDPFFWNDAGKLKLKYDFIACCEVIEHFHNPAKEFKLLRSLLKPGGALFCMTEFIVEAKDFSEWYYKNDLTHVFFYHINALEWIKKNYGFSTLKIKGRLIELVV